MGAGALRRVLPPVAYRDKNAADEHREIQGGEHIAPAAKRYVLVGCADQEFPGISERIRNIRHQRSPLANRGSARTRHTAPSAPIVMRASPRRSGVRPGL